MTLRGIARWGRRRSAALGVALALAGCTAKGATEPQCTFNSDCSGNLVCSAGFCRAACHDSKDCPPGDFCLPAAQPEETLCVNENSQPFCSATKPCASGWTCNPHGECTLPCESNDECIPYSTDAVCDPDGFCDVPSFESRFAQDGGTAAHLALVVESMPPSTSGRQDERVGGTGQFKVKVSDTVRSNAPSARRAVSATVTSGASVYPAQVLTNLLGEAVFTVRARLSVGPFTLHFSVDGAPPVDVALQTTAADPGSVFTACNAESAYATPLPGPLSTAAIGTIRDVAGAPLLGVNYVLTDTALVRVVPTGFASVIAGSLSPPTGTCRSGDHGPAVEACLKGATRVTARPASSDVFIAQGAVTSVIQRIDSVAETIETVAGGGATVLTAGMSAPATTVQLGPVLALGAGDTGVVGIVARLGAGFGLYDLDTTAGTVTLVQASPLQTACVSSTLSFGGCPTQGCDLVVRPGGLILLSGLFCIPGGSMAPTTAVAQATTAGVFTLVAGGGTDVSNAPASATAMALTGAAHVAGGGVASQNFYLLEDDGIAPRLFSVSPTGAVTFMAGAMGGAQTSYTPAASCGMTNPHGLFVRMGSVGWVEDGSDSLNSIVRMIP